MSKNIKRVTYGDWIIDVDIDKTKAFYKEFESKNTQCDRNFTAYCNKLSEDENNFFEDFGISPICCENLSSLGLCKDGTYPTFGSYYFSGSFVHVVREIPWTPEELIEHDFIDDRPDPAFDIGSFNFYFQNPESEFSHIPDDLPNGFICVEFSAESIPWLLDEKCEETMFYPPKKWEIIKRIKQKINDRKSMREYNERVKNEVVLEFNSLGISYDVMSKNEISRYMDRWISTFSKEKYEKAKKICLPNSQYNNYLWHLFSYNMISAKEEEVASAEFDNVNHEECFILLNYEKIGFEVKNAAQLSSDIVNKYNDIIITNNDFKWTYCHTHEEYCGPYFYRV